MIDYTVRKSVRAKHLRITIKHDGAVVVTVPRRVSAESVEKFFHEKIKWVEKKIEEMKARDAKRPVQTIPKGSKKDLEENKNRALALVHARLEHFNTLYGLVWKNVSVKNLTTRWGSCSKVGNLNFSYKIVYLPKELADYLIVHELCHLGEFNHSKKFWLLVSKAIPDYAILRKQLRHIE
jgi:predicted metal-dependent hydrolase